MAKTDEPSRRLIDQRVRNRTIESLQWLAQGEQGFAPWGIEEYFRQFEDFVYVDDTLSWRNNTTLIADEAEAIELVLRLMERASDPHIPDPAVLISSGQLAAIQEASRAALDLMLARGTFREDVEENQPSGEHPLSP